MNNMKFRNSSKIKTEHSIIRGLKKILHSIESWEEIQGIIPGIIKPSNSHSGVKITFQYLTPTGVKCLAKGKGTVQEVFFISSNPEKLKIKLINFLEPQADE